MSLALAIFEVISKLLGLLERRAAEGDPEAIDALRASREQVDAALARAAAHDPPREGIDAIDARLRELGVEPPKER